MSETPTSDMSGGQAPSGGLSSAMARVTGAFSNLPPWATNTLIALAIFVVGGVAGWIGRGYLAGPPDVPTMTVFEEWRLFCPDTKDKDNSCQLSQDVVNSKEGTRLVRVVLARDTNKSMVMALTVPLEVFLEPGVQLKIGDDQPRVYQYRTCTEVGCSTVIPVDDQMLASLAKAQVASVVVAAPQDGKGVELALSMKGYAEAWRDFQNNEAKHKSWWRRLWS